MSTSIPGEPIQDPAKYEPQDDLTPGTPDPTIGFAAQTVAASTMEQEDYPKIVGLNTGLVTAPTQPIGSLTSDPNTGALRHITTQEIQAGKA